MASATSEEFQPNQLMKKSYAEQMVSTSTPAKLSVLLKLDPKTSESWGTEDLRALIRHQMAAPLEFALGSVKLSQAQQQTATESLTQASRSNIATFGDLFQIPKPPL